MAKVNRIVLENLHDEEFDVRALALEVCLSRSQLFRRVKAVTGFSPSGYILEQRLLRAWALLHAPETQSVKIVAFACGFSDPSYFTRAFRKRFGVPPGRGRGIT